MEHVRLAEWGIVPVGSTILDANNEASIVTGNDGRGTLRILTGRGGVFYINRQAGHVARVVEVTPSEGMAGLCAAFGNIEEVERNF